MRIYIKSNIHEENANKHKQLSIDVYMLKQNTLQFKMNFIIPLLGKQK